MIERENTENTANMPWIDVLLEFRVFRMASLAGIAGLLLASAGLGLASNAIRPSTPRECQGTKGKIRHFLRKNREKP